MTEQPQLRFFDRTRTALQRGWRDFTGAARVALTGNLRPHLPPDDVDRLRRQIDICLEARGGEANARSYAAALGRTYLDLNADGRRRFFALLATEYGVDPQNLRAAIDTLELAWGEPARRAQAEQRLREVLVPPRIRLLRHFNGLRQGVKFLVDLRADLLDLAREDPALRPLDRELRDLLASWFDVGFLELHRITWDAPASLLEKLIAYEAVHAIRSWDDLKDRLDSDRRCYAFFHPAMPKEPLIFVEVALVDGMADNIHDLLDGEAPAEDPEAANTAIFYSISNAQAGLAGVSFGDFLIKRVVRDLSHDFPNLKTFATLSPIPGFLSWLKASARAEFLRPSEREAIALLPGMAERRAEEALLDLLATPDWPDRPEICAAIEPALLRLCAHYLVEEREKGRARDRVAHFHLSNGARVERLNWLADRSPKGLAQSAGIMVNYRYKLDDIETNHEQYTVEGRIAAAGPVRNLLK